MPGRALHRELERQVGEHHVLTRPADLAAYAFDSFGASGDRFLPEAVVLPASTAEVSGVVQVCGAHDAALVPRGAGTGYAGGSVALTGGVVLATARMAQVRDVGVGTERVHAMAGAITASVKAAAAAAGWYFPPDPGSAATSTIGGNIACNAAGPHALRYGTTGDHLTGLTVVLADGSIERLGDHGQGGGNLLRLLVGSEGTLGVITEATLRLIPQPQARVTLAAVFASAASAQDAVAEMAAARLLPAAFEFMDAAALAAVARSGVHGGPLEGVLGRARQVGGGQQCLVLVELEGDASATAAEADTARSALERAGATTVMRAADAGEAAMLWTVRKAISAAVAKVMIGKVNEDVVVPRDRVDELLQAVRLLGVEHHVPVVTFGHLGDGNLHCTLLIDPRRAGDRARADAAADALFDTVLRMDGSLTGEHGIGYTKLAHLPQQVGTGGVALMQRLKRALDPAGLLNPGKKVPGFPVSHDAKAQTETLAHA